MEYLWIIYTFIYTFLKGAREGMKKAALKKSGSNEILFFYTLIGLIMVLPFSKGALTTPPAYIFYSFIKAAVICVAWLLAFNSLKKMPVSLFGVITLSRVLFSMLLGVVALGESFTIPKAIGLFLVISGLFLVNAKKDTDKKQVSVAIIFVALLSCFLTSISGVLDKVLMKNMDSSQLQFWFMLFMTLIYGIILIIKKEKISFKNIKTNYWIPLMSLSLVLGDKLWFEANANPLSEVTLMTLIKPSAVIITILIGKFAFKEKNVLYKLLCSIIILAGIAIALTM